MELFVLNNNSDCINICLPHCILQKLLKYKLSKKAVR